MDTESVGNVRKLYWSAGDRIAVNGLVSQPLPEDLPEKTQTISFSFAEPLSAPYKMLYPASVYEDETHISLPAVQDYRAGGFAEGMFPMAGYGTEEGNLSIHHLCAILKIQIVRAATEPDTDPIVSVRFQGRGGEQVCGRFELDYQNALLSGTSDASKDKELRVVHSLSTESAAVYYLVVPAGAYASGYDVTVVDANGHYMVKSKTEAVTLEAGHLYAMSEFAFVPTGTEMDVVISNAGEFVDFAAACNRGDYSGKSLVATLSDNISFDETSSAAFNATGGVNSFAGLLDGAGHSISGLQATVPLFQTISGQGVVRDLSLSDDCSFTFTHANTAQGRFGAVVGYHGGLLEHVSSAASVSLAPVSGITQQTVLGGLVGRATTGTVKDCSCSGLISTPSGFTGSKLLLVGGLVGAFTNVGSISGSTFSGAISNEAQITSTSKEDPYTDIGGVVGYNSGGSVTSCRVLASHEAVPGTSGSGIIVHKSTVAYYSAVGGIVGDNLKGTVSGCVNEASVLVTVVRASDTDTDAQARYIKTGGIVGRNKAEGTVTACTNNGSVTHYSNTRLQSAGGIVGLNLGTVGGRCVNTGAIAFGETTVNPLFGARIPYMGGIIGENMSSLVSDVHNQGTVTLTRMEMTTTGFSICLGGVIGWNSGALDGGSSKAISNEGTVLFDTNSNRVSDDGYRLGGIIGHSEGSVKNARNAGYVHFRWSHTSRVAQNVRLGGIVGQMAGNGEISGCVNEGGDDNAGEVFLDITKAAVAHTDNCFGGILGYATSNVSLSGCSNSGTVHGGNATKVSSTSCFAGGIVAYLAGASGIANCSNAGTVTNQQFTNTATSTVAAYTGGIAGYVKALPIARIPITGCEVTTDNLVATRGFSGGIVGYAEMTDMTGCRSWANANGSTALYIGGIAGWVADCTVSNCHMYGTTIVSRQMYQGGGIVAKLDSGSSLSNCSSAVTTIRAVLTEDTGTPNFTQGGAIAGSSVTGTYIDNCTYPASGTIEHGNQSGTTTDAWQICGDSNFTPGTPSADKTKVSIIGDSISTFKDYIVSGYRTYYPAAGVETVDQTYWYKFIYEYMPNAELCKNLAWSGSLVHRITDTAYSGTHWFNHYFYARAAADGFGDADVLIVNGGTNDYGYQGGTIATESSSSLAPGYKITGTSIPTDSEFAGWFAAADAATNASQVASLPDDSFILAYIKLLQLAKVTCRSGLKIILCIGDGVNATCEQSIIKMAAHYGAAIVDFFALNGNYKYPVDPSYNPIPKGSSVHPNAAGMAFMAEYMWSQTEDFLK
ncbi:MAG: SGNH/GDSL hydrolase family protein [Bacteroidales bacterium]|nr:SGNH/GDSL hydrolase family protein [Bacteroidales bacterium]